MSDENTIEISQEQLADIATKTNMFLFQQISQLGCPENKKVEYNLTILDNLFVNSFADLMIRLNYTKRQKEDLIIEHFKSVRERLNAMYNPSE